MIDFYTDNHHLKIKKGAITAPHQRMINTLRLR